SRAGRLVRKRTGRPTRRSRELPRTPPSITRRCQSTGKSLARSWSCPSLAGGCLLGNDLLIQGLIAPLRPNETEKNAPDRLIRRKRHKPELPAGRRLQFGAGYCLDYNRRRDVNRLSSSQPFIEQSLRAQPLPQPAEPDAQAV